MIRKGHKNYRHVMALTGFRPRIVLEPSLKGKEKSCLDDSLPPGLIACVFDPATYEALGERIVTAVPQERLQKVMLTERPSADLATVERIRAASTGCASYLAIGSGTINDLCKYAAYLDGWPYAVFATAPSMNGYVSANASLSDGGFKQSYPAAAPVAVFADLEILAAAPARLIRSGLGDSLCRATAQADWLLSHYLLGTPYDERPFALLAPYEAPLFASADRLVQADVAAIEWLMRTLLASGEGMRLAGGSYPASQGEHMIAHALDMMQASRQPNHHGEEIGVTTLTMAAIQNRVLSMDAPDLTPRPFPMAHMSEVFGRELAGQMEASHAKKRQLWERQASGMPGRWREAKSRLRTLIPEEAALRSVLQAAGAPTEPQALGWQQADYDCAVALAAFTRDRFTFLDLLTAP